MFLLFVGYPVTQHQKHTDSILQCLKFFFFFASKCLFLDFVCILLYMEYFGMLLTLCKHLLKGSCTVLKSHVSDCTHVWYYLFWETVSYFCNATIKEWIYDPYISLCWYQKLLIRLFLEKWIACCWSVLSLNFWSYVTLNNNHTLSSSVVIFYLVLHHSLSYCEVIYV